MKRIVSAFLILALTFLIVNPAPADAGGGNGWIIGGALLGGGLVISSIIGRHDHDHHDHVIVGPVYQTYSPPPPIYYSSSPPVVYQPQPVWIPEHYELRWMTTCQLYRYPYPYQNCYQHQITVFIPGHWEYR